jgi:hypothetical protein
MNSENLSAVSFCMACFAFVIATSTWTKVVSLEAKLKKGAVDSASKDSPQITAKPRKAVIIGAFLVVLLIVAVLVVLATRSR